MSGDSVGGSGCCCVGVSRGLFTGVCGDPAFLFPVIPLNDKQQQDRKISGPAENLAKSCLVVNLFLP